MKSVELSYDYFDLTKLLFFKFELFEHPPMVLIFLTFLVDEGWYRHTKKER